MQHKAVSLLISLEISMPYNNCVCVSAINECLSEPCGNDATCIDGLNEYTCVCAAGYEGVNCEIGMYVFFIILSLLKYMLIDKYIGI